MSSRRIMGAIIVLECLALAGLAAYLYRNTARLHVQSEPTGATVILDGTVRGITPVELRVVRPGLHQLRTSRPGFVPDLRTVQLASGEAAAALVKLRPISGLLLVLSDPPGAEVWLQERRLGVTPLPVTDLPLGTHRLELRHPDCEARSVEVPLSDRTPVRVSVTLPLVVAPTAQFTSSPPGATVSVDGRPRGTTPLSLERLPTGVHEVVVALDRRQPHSERLELKAGQSATLQVELKPVPARLHVTSEPSGASVALDGRPRGRTPLALESLTPGSVRVVVSLDGYTADTQQVALGASESREVNVRLLPNGGTIELITAPGGVSVFVDGQPAGFTPESEAGVASAPLRVALVGRPEHRLRLQHEGCQTIEKTVQVQAGETLTVYERLPPRFAPDLAIRTTSNVEKVRFGRLAGREPDGSWLLETRPGHIDRFPTASVESVETLSPAPIPTP